MFYMLLLRIDVAILKMIWTHNTRRKEVYYNGKKCCNKYEVIAIRCCCDDKKLVASRRNKLRGNRLIQQKNLAALIPKHRKLCSLGGKTVPKTM